MRTSKVLAFSVPPEIVKEVEALARRQRSTKSELFREMFRVYQRYSANRERDEERWILDLIAEVKAEEAKRPTPVEELLRESEELRRFGRQQAKKLGIKAKDINQIIREYREERARNQG
ncbi:MAG: ribbon-helix-helix protein, CopG family [Acidobacteria bacterium]|nr:ribbon-helix-helix protein, CopG family [Acidobacteriota bacterium]